MRTDLVRALLESAGIVSGPESGDDIYELAGLRCGMMDARTMTPEDQQAVIEATETRDAARALTKVATTATIDGLPVDMSIWDFFFEDTVYDLIEADPTFDESRFLVGWVQGVRAYIQTVQATGSMGGMES